MISLIKFLTYFLLFEIVIALNIPAQRTPVTARSYHSRRDGLVWRNSSEPFNSTSRTNSVSHANSTGTYHSCGDSFFDFTEQNIKDSKFGDYYRDWSRTAHLHPHYSASNDEMAFFAKDQIGWPNMKCTLSFGGCDNRPSCKDVIEYSEGDADKARRVYFTIESTHNMIFDASNIYKAFNEAETDLMLLIPEASRTFFWQRDEKQYAHCQRVKWAVNTLVQVAVTASFLIAGPFLDSLLVAGNTAHAAERVSQAQKYEKRLQKQVKRKDAKLISKKMAKNSKWMRIEGNSKHANQERKEVEKEMGKIEKMLTDHQYDLETAATDIVTLENKLRILQQANELGFQAAKKKHGIYGAMVKTEKGWRFNDGRLLRDTQQIVQGVIAAEMGFPLTKHIEEDCMDQDPNKPDPSVINTREFSIMFGIMLREYRKYVGLSMSRTMKGSGFGDSGAFLANDSSVLSMSIADGSYLKSEEQDLRDEKANDPFELEEPILQHLKGVMISEAWTANMCYMACVDDFKRDCHNDAGELSAMRFCPTVGTICQAQCWQNSRDKARNIPVFGVDQLEHVPWDISKDLFLRGSWNNYQLNSVYRTHARPTIDDIIRAPTSAVQNGPGFPRAADFTLPVCKSHYLSIRNYKLEGLWYKDDLEQSVFPCTCGDAFSSETSDFMDATGIITWTGHEAVTKICAKQLTKSSGMGPAQFFLAMCALKVRWPIQQNKQEEGPHPACEGVLHDAKATFDATLDLEAVDSEFCLNSRVMKDGRFVESEHIPFRITHGWRTVPTFQDMCEDFTNRTLLQKAGNMTQDLVQETKDQAEVGRKIASWTLYDLFNHKDPVHKNRTDVHIG